MFDTKGLSLIKLRVCNLVDHLLQDETRTNKFRRRIWHDQFYNSYTFCLFNYRYLHIDKFT